MDIEKVMDFLVSESSRSAPAAALSDVFDRLLWCMSDQGASLLDVREKWLDGDDEIKAEIALRMNEVFPARSRAELVRLLARVKTRFPRFTELCEEMLAAWDLSCPSTENQ